MIYLGKDSRELEWEIIEKERKPTRACVMEQGMTVGDCCNQLCWIQKVLIYKTRKNVLQTIHLGVKRGSMYPLDLIYHSSVVWHHKCQFMQKRQEVFWGPRSMYQRSSPGREGGGSWFPPEAGIVWLHLCEVTEALVGLVITAETGVTFRNEKV